MIKKDVVVFGTGKYFENYMMCKGFFEKPLFAVDNDASKVGSVKLGVMINDIASLNNLVLGTFYVVVCARDYEPIFNQLKDMNITDVQRYVPLTVETEASQLHDMLFETDESNRQKSYGVGYVPGAFDLFHAGHLNLLRNAKTCCEYLIAGVLTDELYEYFKHKKCVIPFEQRYAIVDACRFVDRTVPVDFSNTRKIDAWNLYHFDCHFSGDDHVGLWDKDMEELAQVGATMKFFKYSRANSSSNIRRVNNKDE